MSQANKNFDCIILGLGAMGSAALYHTAKAGASVLGIDQFSPPHQQGSSTGETRIIREAYFEHPSYVPLVQRAYDLWAELQDEEPLLVQTGGLMIGPQDGIVVQGSLASARQHALAHQLLSPSDVARRFPQFELDGTMAAVWESRAGVLFPEKSIAAHLKKAAQANAQVITNEKVLGWKTTSSGISVKTSQREVFAKRLALCSGPWIHHLVPDLNLPLTIERQIQFWFEPLTARDTWNDSPVYLCETPEHSLWYGFPDFGRGIKVARHHNGAPIDPNDPARSERPGDESAMRQIVQRFIPSANGAKLRSRVCLYTNTPDGHFLLDWHPRDPNILLVSPCSGHGFKFSSAIGELIKDLLLDEPNSLDINLFKWRW